MRHFIWLHSYLTFLVSANVLCCSSVCMSVLFFRTVFNVGPDTHIDNLEASEQVVLDGTSKWSCKIAVNGKWSLSQKMWIFNKTLLCQLYLNNKIYQLVLYSHKGDYQLTYHIIKLLGNHQGSFGGIFQRNCGTWWKIRNL